MTRLKACNVPKYKGRLTYVTLNEGQYGQEVVFEWAVRGHPRIDVFTEKFKIGSESYGEKAFERLQKAMKILTGREIDRDSDLEEDKLTNLKVWLSFGSFNGSDYISSRSLRKDDESQAQTTQEAPKSLVDDLNDEIPF